jgi:tetratricopeptide (TPR) repeat protein
MNLASLKNSAQDFPGFEREGQRALELDPNSADIHAFYARGLFARRRFDEAILHMRRAQELDPLSPALITDLGRILYSAGQREQAFEQYRKALELNPNYFGAHHHLSNYYLGQGKYDEAIAEAKKIGNSSGEELGLPGFLGYVYGVAGRRAEAQKILHEFEEQSKQRHVSPAAFSMIYTGLGDKDRAFEYLQQQVGENPASLVFLQVQPEWDSLRSDPRYTDLLREMKFAP